MKAVTNPLMQQIIDLSKPMVDSQIKRYLLRTADSAIVTVDQWQKRLVDPANAFEWSDKAMEASAQLRIIGRILSFLSDRPSNIDRLHGFILEMLLEYTRAGTSSSAGHNAMNVFYSNVCAHMIRDTEHYL